MIQLSYISIHQLLLLVAISSHAPYALWKAKKDLHILQLNSYRNKRYCQWLRKKITLLIQPQELLPAIAFIPIFFRLVTLSMIIFILSYAFIFIARSRIPEKKPLIFTPRAIRLYGVNILLLLCLYVTILYFALPVSIPHLFLLLSILVTTTLLSPLILLLSNSLLLPLEATITHWYFNDAKKRLEAMPNLLIIAITGSFGKTTTKHILYEILRNKYSTLMPPGSFNTPMGITKIVRTQLKPTHEILVAEMSAKQKGDIAELCALAKPRFGILTAIGKQHLETFGSIENIKRTKNELIECLPTDGTAFFNIDDPYSQELATLTKKKSIYYGIKAANLNYRAQHVEITDEGSVFTVSKNNAPPVTFTTKLLGEHNIYNILAAIAAAAELGMPLAEMIYPIKQLRPIEHRLELKKTPANITIIDDAFNSNPIGSKMALDVLAQIGGDKKIIVTPGMIELGREEYALNKKFGEYIAEVCHYVILVGKKQTLAIQEGLKERNFTNNAIYVARDFAEANAHLHTIVKAGDVVLFENDLPDSYAEK